MKKTCSEIKDLIFLYGEGELSAAEIDKLEYHISGCTECRTEYESVLNFKKIITSTAIQTSQHYFPDTRLERVLDGINNSGKTSVISVKLRVFTLRLIDMLYRPPVRFAMLFIVLIFAVTFLLQSSLTFSDISKLEDKMQSADYTQNINASVIDPDKVTGNLKDFYLFLKGDNAYLNISSHLVIVDRNQFRNFFRIHNQLLYLYNKNPEGFSKKYPELTRLLLEQIDPQELDSTLNNGDLIGDLNKILKGELK